MASEPSAAIVRALDLTRLYRLGNTTVVGIEGVDLDISAGQLVVLKGDSGSGKSTLLALLAGLDRPTRGELTVADVELGRASRDDLTRFRRDVVGMVFQSFNLLPTLSVVENTLLPAVLAGKPLEEGRARALQHLSWLGMEKRLDHLPGQLSGGEMQRTAIARALVNEPSLILADEPTGNLDSTNGRIVIDLLVELNRAFGRSVIIATHSNLADAAATVSIRLKDGRIVD
jgi:ABC-type lipoprotein export system ATPase subunit